MSRARRFRRVRRVIGFAPLPRSVVRGGIAPATDDVSDRHASFTPPDPASLEARGIEPRSRLLAGEPASFAWAFAAVGLPRPALATRAAVSKPVAPVSSP